MGLPHARGGVSKARFGHQRAETSSPRPWGCFHVGKMTAKLSGVFPTPVGVFPKACPDHRNHASLPHARGGVSMADAARLFGTKSSPRPWGCFRVQGAWNDRHGGLPHARGGVSHFITMQALVFRSSPRPWGCFTAVERKAAKHSVFPTPVGVFPCSYHQLVGACCLPHARGGVSYIVRKRCKRHESSPRPWGCF